MMVFVANTVLHDRLSVSGGYQIYTIPTYSCSHLKAKSNEYALHYPHQSRIHPGYHYKAHNHHVHFPPLSWASWCQELK